VTLPPGTRLGPYEIVSAIGAGGMGEVYRARDTNLRRDVAIKTLRPAFEADPDRLVRFRREARVLASLNHSNIALIHGFEESDDTQAFVMELVDGPTLAERIANGPIAIQEALAIARQIAEALSAAHDQGIVHRDLKPANVKVRPDGVVKVLDFGIAKTLEPPAASTAAAAAADTGTGTGSAVTKPGVIFGTPAYMSPEQARGLPLDRRTDIWAFGCVLFEMLTARRAFTGRTRRDGDAAVNRAPDWSRLPVATPAAVRRLMRRCLEEDPKRRLADAADARLEIDDAASGTPEPPDPDPRPITRWGPAALAVVFAALIASAVTWAIVTPHPPRPAQPTWFAIVPPPAQSLDVQDNDRNLALSPDGRYLVYRSGGTNNGGPLMLRSMDRLDAQPLAGVTNARNPFFSSDGRWVGFFDRREIKRISLTGDPATTICKFEGFPRGASWGDDNTIVFATADEATGLRRVPASGGESTELTTPDPARQERDHLFPAVLPGARGVLFTITALGQKLQTEVAVLDLRTGQRRTLIPGASQAEYIAPQTASGEMGYLLYAAAGALRAVHFDLDQLKVAGESIAVVEHLQMAITGAANYAVAGPGTLAYIPGVQAPARSLVWVGRDGREERINAPLRTYAVPRLSPDGGRVAVEVRDQDNDLWIWDFARQKLEALTFGPAMDQSPVWTPGGRRVLFASNRLGVFNLYAQNADGTGSVDRLTGGRSSLYPTTITQDGSRVICNELVSKGVGIAMVPLTSQAARGPLDDANPLINTPFEEVAAQLSPDGRYLAFQSNESGRSEVYVRPFPNVNGGRWQVTLEGGSNPMWARSGAELFYLDGAAAMTAVAVHTAGDTFSSGSPKTLFDARIYTADGTRAYDVSPDGRFLLIKESRTGDSTLTPAGVLVFFNWLDDLRRRIPGRS
jgi:serine/threonine protein kinase/Tol biopolymer transport system component